MRYAIDVIQPDGKCRMFVVELVGGTERGIRVLKDGDAMTIDWGSIAGWSPIDEDQESVPRILAWVPAELDFVACI